MRYATRYTKKFALAFGLLLAGAGMILTGCDSVTDLSEANQNPNDPVEVASSQQLPGNLVNFSYQVIGNEAVRTPSLWIQQAAQNANEPAIDTYDYTETDPNNLWGWLYAGSIKDARNVQEAARSEENFATLGIGQIIEAWSWSITTDLFGDVPLEEAYQAGNPTPAYSEQAAVYDTVFAKLERARQNLAEGNREPLGSADLLYGGDTDKWISLAWALEAKFHMRLSESDFGAGLDGSGGRQARAQAALDAAQNAFPNGNADNAAFAFPGGDNKENPWYQFTIQGVWVNSHQLSSHYVGMLKDHEDPRLGIQARQVGAIDGSQSPPTAGAPGFSPAEFDPSEDFDPSDGTYQGHENGVDDTEGTSNVSSIGPYYSAQDAPLIWMNYAELKFIESEANLILGNGPAARTAYEEGIRASMNQLGVTDLANVDGSFVDDFVADRLTAYDNASDKLRPIITEKYKANFLRLTPYHDWRRTGYPELDPAANAETENGVIPVRFPYPNGEFNNNEENVPTDIGRGIESLDAPVDWDSGGS